MNPVNQLPPVGRIEGLALESHADRKKAVVQLEYTDHKSQRHVLKIPILDALYLSNMLEQMSEDGGYEDLRLGS